MNFTPLRPDSIKSYNLNLANDEVYALYQSKTHYGVLEGIVCLLNIDKNDSKVDVYLHERTISQKVNKYFHNFVQTGIQFTPVLFTYDTNNDIPDLAGIANTLAFSDSVKVCSENKNSSITFIKQQTNIILEYINKLKEFYLIDGHHRYQAARNLAEISGSNTLAVMLVAKKRLFLDSFHRIITNKKSYKRRDIINKIMQKFDIEKVPSFYIPRTNNYFGMQCGKEWYKLIPKNHLSCRICNSDNLTKYLLEPAFSIYDANIDEITYLNSRDLFASQDKYVDNIIFTLSSLSMDEYITKTKKRLFSPPHTTCFLPKPDNECLVYSHMGMCEVV